MEGGDKMLQKVDCHQTLVLYSSNPLAKHLVNKIIIIK